MRVLRSASSPLRTSIIAAAWANCSLPAVLIHWLKNCAVVVRISRTADRVGLVADHRVRMRSHLDRMAAGRRDLGFGLANDRAGADRQVLQVGQRQRPLVRPQLRIDRRRQRRQRRKQSLDGRAPLFRLLRIDRRKHDLRHRSTGQVPR